MQGLNKTVKKKGKFVMEYKKIEKPEINPNITKPDIIGWKFRKTPTPNRGKYCIRFTLNFADKSTKHCQVGGFKTKEDALYAKEEIITSLHQKSYMPFKFTLKEFFDYWLYYYMMDERKIAYSTFMNYRNMIYNHFLKFFPSSKKIHTLETKDIVKFLNSISSDSSRNCAYAVLGSAFKKAEEMHIISRNVAKYSIQITRIENRKHSNKKKRPVFTLKQVLQILLVCKEKQPDFYLLFALSVTTGIRISEALGLQFENIDIKNNTISITHQKGRPLKTENIEKGKITSQLIPPKSRHGYRTIPIPEFIKVELLLTKSKYEELKETNAKFDYTPNFVFVNSIGHPISRDKKISNLFKEIILACDLDPDKYHWHDLRHTYATLLEINDINLKKIMQVMGHGHVDMTKSVYINTEEVVYDQTAVMEKWIEKLCTPEGSVDLNTFDPNHIPNKFNWWRESKWTQK